MNDERVGHANNNKKQLTFISNSHFCVNFFKIFVWHKISTKPRMNLNRLNCFSSQSIELEQRKWKIFTTSKYCRRQNVDHESREVEHPTIAENRTTEPTNDNAIDARVVPPQTIDSKLMRNGYFQWKSINVQGVIVLTLHCICKYVRQLDANNDHYLL